MGDSRYLPKSVHQKFIEVYKEHPALWKIKSKEYTNKNLKNMGYDALTKVCKDVEPNVNRDWVSKKIQCLRGAFRKELKKIEQSQRSGASPDDIYVPSLWYFELLQFTIDQEESTESIDNIRSLYTEPNEETLDEINDNMGSQNGSTNKQPDQSTQATLFKENYNTEANKSRKRKKTEREEAQIFFKTCSSDLARDNDEFEAVDVNVAAKLRRMDQMQQVYAESLIQKILTKGLLKKLSENTDLYENSPWTTNPSVSSPTISNITTLTPMTSPPLNDEHDMQSNLRQYYETIGLTNDA